MSYKLEITRDGVPLLSKDLTPDEVIDLLSTAMVPVDKKEKKERPIRYGSGGAKEYLDDSEKMTRAVGRHPETQNIEKMLIDGETVPSILEKIEVSAPTVYLIKTRLKKEGRLKTI